VRKNSSIIPYSSTLADNTSSDREINGLNRPGDRAATTCYNREFMVQFFLTILAAFRVSSAHGAVPSWKSSLSASKSPCSNESDRGHR
jgi:hypothetical protein